MQRTRVVNVRFDECDEYVGRPTLFGNPFAFRNGTSAEHVVGSLDEALQRYIDHLAASPQILRRVSGLRGMRLGCWCRPKAGFQGRVICHAQILAALADGVEPEEVD